MDVEKYASGKLYIFFEWAYKLIVWNLLSFLVIALFCALPVIGFYTVQNNYSIKQIDMIDNSISVTLNNGNVTSIGSITEKREIEEYSFNDSFIMIKLDNQIISIPNKDMIKTIDSIKLENNDLLITGMKKDFLYENVINNYISAEDSKIDINNNTIIVLKNGTQINFGNVIETKHTLAGILIIVAVLLGIFAFIPCFVTIFSMIKIFGDNGSTNTIVLYFDRLLDNFKSLWRLEVIIVPSLGILAFALYVYYMIINANGKDFFYTMAYDFILVALLLFILWLVSLPMTLGYFRMKSYTIFKFTLVMAFKNILYTFLYLFLIVGMLLLCLLNNFFIPIWFLVGFSLPELFMYLISKKKYRYLVNNFESYRDEDIYELNDDKEQKGEK